MSVHVHVVAETHAPRTNVVRVHVGSYVYMYRFAIPLSDLHSFRRASTFRTLPMSLSFSSPFLPFQDLLDTLHVERSVSFQALLCKLAQAESNKSSRVLRYFARRLALIFSGREGILRKTTSLSYKKRQLAKRVHVPKPDTCHIG